MATCSGDKTIRIWAPASSAPGAAAPMSDETPRTQALYNAVVAHASWKCIALLEDFTNRTARCCEWSPCGRFLAAGSFDGNAYVWQAAGPALDPGAAAPVTESTLKFQLMATLEGHENEVKAVAWSPSGSLLATCSRDKSCWIWELVDADRSPDFDCVAVLHGHDQDVKHCRWHPNRELLFTASYDNTVKIWGESDDDWACTQTLEGHESTVWCLAFDTDGHHLVTVGDDRAVMVWRGKPAPAGSSTVVDAMEYHRIAVVPEAHSRAIFSCDWSRRKKSADDDAAAADADIYQPRIATSGADDCIRVFREERDVAAGLGGSAGAALSFVPMLCVDAAHAGDVNTVRWHPRDNTLLASGGDDGLIKLWRYTEL